MIGTSIRKELIIVLATEGLIHYNYSEAVVWRCSVKKVHLERSQNSQENTCARDSFLIKLHILSAD